MKMIGASQPQRRTGSEDCVLRRAVSAGSSDSASPRRSSATTMPEEELKTHCLPALSRHLHSSLTRVSSA